MQHLAKLRFSLLRVAATSVLTVGSISLSVASASAASDLKPVPVAPSTPKNAVTAPITSKPLTEHLSASPEVAWSLSLTASPSALWPTQFSQLTATANMDVGPTPYYISIYDLTAHSYVGICGTGTVCAAFVSQPFATTHSYVANVSFYPSTYPPTGVQATSSTVRVDWRSINIRLQASPATLNVGSTTALTSTTSTDVGPTPFYAQIYDATTGTRLAFCGFGTTCTAHTSQVVATTHRFVAYVSSNTPDYPPTNIHARSNDSYVTWSNAGFTLALSSSPASAGVDTLKAISNKNVGPTPWWIEIYNLDTHSRIANCGFGSSCSVSISLTRGANHFIAFTGSSDIALPPANTQASSNVITDVL